jgi:hypothetical protein
MSPSPLIGLIFGTAAHLAAMRRFRVPNALFMSDLLLLVLRPRSRALERLHLRGRFSTSHRHSAGLSWLRRVIPQSAPRGTSTRAEDFLPVVFESTIGSIGPFHRRWCPTAVGNRRLRPVGTNVE